MTPDGDLDLRQRMERLASAVPVAERDHARSITLRVPPGPVGRRFAFGGIVPIVGALLVVVVVAGLTKVGPFAAASATPEGSAGTSPSPLAIEAPEGVIQPDGSMIAVARAGGFELRLTSTSAAPGPGEPTRVFASYSYVGPSDATTLRYSGPAVTFRIEQLDATAPQGIGIDVLYQATCETRSYDRGSFLEAPLGLVDQVMGDGVMGDWLSNHLADSQLRLPAGTWRVTAFFVAQSRACGSPAAQAPLEASVTLVVNSGLATPAPSVGTESTVTSGDFTFTLKAAKPTFSTSESIDVVGLLTYNGLKNHTTIRRAVWGPIEFVVPGLPRGIEMQYFSAPFACIDMTLERGVPFEVPLQNVHSGLPADFSLPQGSWQVRAGAGFHLTEDCFGPGESLDTSIVFDVADDGVQSTPAPAGELDVGSDDNFELRLQSDKSAYFSDEPIDVAATVAYLGSAPASYSDSLYIGGNQTDGKNVVEICCRPLSCRSGPTGELPVEVAFRNGLDAEGPDSDWMNAFTGHPLLHLSPGRWRLAATLDAEIPGCTLDATQTHLTVSIYITVLHRDLIE